MNFNREKFLLWLLAALLGWQAGIFTFGTYKCTTVEAPQEVCPNLGDRFETFVNSSIAAVLGLIAGGAAINATRKRGE